MLCVSKTGDNLRNYCRMYPGLVNNTTVIWFMPWPLEALIEVANKYICNLKLDGNPNDDLESTKREKEA
jgi:dynein heavy chain